MWKKFWRCFEQNFIGVCCDEKQKNKHLGIEIDAELHYKLHYIAKYYGRSGNGEILYLIRREIMAFEKAEGEIELPR